MASESTTRWPLLNERAPFAPPAARTGGRRPPRSVWLLTGLAFLCGGLVSAAGFSIGWRHQAQRNTDAESALATATARTHSLGRRLVTLQATLARTRRTAAGAVASERAVVSAAAGVSADATASSRAGTSVSSGAGELNATAGRVASELKTLETYLTTTPTDQLDPGYIASQTGYLTRQLGKLQSAGGSLGASIGSLDAALRKLVRSAGALSAR